MRRARLLVLLCGLMVVGPWAAVAQDVDGARDRVAGLEEELEDVTRRYEGLIGAIEGIVVELEDLAREEARLLALADDLDGRLADRARQVYKHGPVSGLEALLAAEGPNAGVERAGFFVAMQQRDMVGVQDAVAVRLRLDQTRELTKQRERELEARAEELAQTEAALEGRLEQAQVTMEALERLDSRQRHLDRGSQQGIYACPLSPAVSHFIDSWGFPRSGGRRHQGTDIMGSMGSPVYAFTGGVIARHSNSRLGGISLYLRGDDGDTYFYTHLQGYAPAGAVGNRVVAGEHIAFNGNTGNARGGAPHIHFERHPGGGSAVNPYPYLAAACF